MISSRKFLRTTHLLSALIVSAYLLVASVTGAILGIHEAWNSDRNLKDLSVSEVIAKAKTHYAELTSLQSNKENQLELQAFDADFQEHKGPLDLASGKITQNKTSPSAFITWVTTLHRSLFLDNSGRFLVGALSLLFCLSLISGLFYLLKNVGRPLELWRKWKYPSWQQSYHLGAGRVFFFPLLVISLSAAILFLYRFKVVEKPATREKKFSQIQGKKIPVEEFDFFQKLPVSNLISIQFPFDESEPFLVETKTGKYQLNSGTGAVESQIIKNEGWFSKDFAFEVHTGKISPIWAWVAVISVLSIPGFVLSGFSIFWKRRRKNYHTASDAQSAVVVVLYGSENGTTRDLAAQYAQQLASQGLPVYLGPLNDWQTFPALKKLLILTATYGDGEAPGNANKFLEKVQVYPLSSGTQVAVVGFGSSSFKTFNRFAQAVRQALVAARHQVEVYETIDDQNPEQIQVAEEKIARLLKLNLSSNLSGHHAQMSHLRVKSRSGVSLKNGYFQLVLEGNPAGLTNGDLIQVRVPETDQWRYYSAAVLHGNIHLFIKKHPGGLASEFLSGLETGHQVELKFVINPGFHLKENSALLICNGTGLAPYLGMINSAKPGSVKLYAGFKYREEWLDRLQQQLNQKVHPDSIWTYSREENGSRITPYLQRDVSAILQHLHESGEVLICGSLELKHETENILRQELLRRGAAETVEDFYLKKLLKADCY